MPDELHQIHFPAPVLSFVINIKLCSEKWRVQGALFMFIGMSVSLGLSGVKDQPKSLRAWMKCFYPGMCLSL